MGASTCAELSRADRVCDRSMGRQAKLRTGVMPARGKTLPISLAESASDCFVSDRALAGTAVGATQSQVYNNPHPASYLALQTWVFRVQPALAHSLQTPAQQAAVSPLHRHAEGQAAPDGTRASKEADMTKAGGQA